MRVLFATTALAMVALSPAMAADVKLYGTVNKSVMAYDDGQESQMTVVDNNNESTRFGMAANKELDNGLTASALFEMEQRSNPSNQVTQPAGGGTPPSIGGTLAERIARVGLAGQWGAVFVGQQDVATDDVYYHDLAAASSVMTPGVAAFGGGLAFRNSATGAVTTWTPSTMAQGADGSLVAADSIRYNSPVFMDFNGSVSVAQGGDVDMAVRYNREYAPMGITVDGALGYTFNNDNASAANEVDGQLQGSVSVKHTSGYGATVAYTGQSLENKTAGVEDPEGIYAKVGYATGPWGFAVDYANFNDGVAVAADQELTSVGLGADYDLGQGVVIGGLYRNYSADVTGVSLDDINLLVMNMRVKF